MEPVYWSALVLLTALYLSLAWWLTGYRYKAGYSEGAIAGRAEGYREGLRIGREIRRKIVLRKHVDHTWPERPYETGSKWETYRCEECPQTRTVPVGVKP